MAHFNSFKGFPASAPNGLLGSTYVYPIAPAASLPEPLLLRDRQDGS